MAKNDETLIDAVEGLMAGDDDPTISRGVNAPASLFAFYEGLAAEFGESRSKIIAAVLAQWKRQYEAGAARLEYEEVTVRKLR